MVTRLLASGILLFGLWVVNSPAADDTWANSANSIQSINSNASGGTIADGVDFTASFNTVNLSTDRTAAIDSLRTIPETSTFLMMGCGLLILGWTWRRHSV